VPGGEADAAIGLFSHDNGDPPRAFVEFKGPTINLDRDRFNGRTPVQQLWDYLNVVPECPWGILCNYVSFRLYHRNKTPYAYELFTLQELRDPDTFRQFYALFERGGLLPLAPGQLPRADGLLQQSEHRQREVGADLYKAYHENRVALVDHLRAAPHSKSLDAAIHIAQKLLDRIVFVAFCKDRDLLPATTIKQACNNIPPFCRVTNPRWRNFRDLFHSIDAGNEQARITRYNGGLFDKDAAVDDLELDDRWTAFFEEIGTYDFRDEVNVDVLGHLFEQSVTDLEALRAAPTVALPKAPKPTIGRRKREGIYYTPAYVTRYIVEHTIGACLRERFGALAEQHRIDPVAEPGPKDLGRWVKYQQARLETLRSLRVCDPACGSGAFLIQAYDYLANAYDEVSAALRLPESDERRLQDQVSDTILRDNLYGVDLSDEAVEITRLALWIRTARVGRSLADLSQNIVRGNSLVGDPEVDPLALDWPATFPRVFGAGKFDCVISNPPYVKLQNFRKRQPQVAKYLVERYRSAQTGNFDLYLPFIERGLDLLKADGRMGFIAPSLWLFNEYGAGLRALVAERRALERFVDFKSFQVFPDATTYTALQFFSGGPRDAIEAADASSGDLDKLAFHPVSYAGRGPGAWALLPQREQDILDTMRAGSVTLAEASQQIFQGLITSADAVYHLIKLGPGRYYSKALERDVEIEDELMKPLISGEDAVPFATPPTAKYLLFPYLLTGDECRLFTAKEMTKRFKHGWAYLRKCEERLRGREDGKMDHDEWYGYVYPKNLDKHEQPKLFVPRLLLHLFAGADPAGKVSLDNVDVGGVLLRREWNLHYILGILNSNACDFAWRLTSKPFRGEYRSANKQFIAPLPVPKAPDQKPVASLARRLAHLHAQRLIITGRVHRRFVTDLPPRELIQTSPLAPSLPKKLLAFDELPVGALIDQLEQFAGRTFKPRDRANWDEYLTAECSALSQVNAEIRDRQAQLNDLVYSLYGLTEDQIRVIKGAPA
jgi:hypothetical protein